MRSWGGHSRKNYIPKISKFNVEKGYLVYQQITFSMLSRFCQLSKTLPHQFLMDKIMLGGILSKIKWKYTSFLHCISIFEGTSHNFFYNTVTRSFSSYCFTSMFTSVDAIGHNFLGLYSTLSETRFFHEYSF